MLFYVSIGKIVTVRIKDNREDTRKPRSRTYPWKTQPAVMLCSSNPTDAHHSNFHPSSGSLCSLHTIYKVT